MKIPIITKLKRSGDTISSPLVILKSLKNQTYSFNKEPLVSIIIPCYMSSNKMDLLNSCIKSIQENYYKIYEIIIVDDNSPIKFEKEILSSFNNVRIIKNKRNSGYGFSCNEGVKISNGKYVIFPNDDMKFDRLCIKELVEFAEKNPDIGIVICKEVDYEDKNKIGSTGNLLDLVGNAYSRGSTSPDKVFFTEKTKIFYAPGAPCFMRRDLFEMVEGFDPDFYLFAEDVDLSWRIRLLGYDISYLPSAIVHHKGSVTTGNFSSNKMYYYERNTLQTLLKNYGYRMLVFVIPMFMFQSLLTIGYFLIVLKVDIVLAILRAYYWNLLNLKNIILKRKKIQSTRVVGDKTILKYIYKGYLRMLRVDPIRKLMYKKGVIKNEY